MKTREETKEVVDKLLKLDEKSLLIVNASATALLAYQEIDSKKKEKVG